MVTSLFLLTLPSTMLGTHRVLSKEVVGLCLSATGTKCITVAFIHRMTGETIYILCGAKQQDKVTASR